MTKILETLRRDEQGQAMIEYAFILALIAFVAVTALGAIGVNVNALLEQVAAGF
jgi:Flp pilus assembly pilin Flp